jgi:hypothetical protein
MPGYYYLLLVGQRSLPLVRICMVVLLGSPLPDPLLVVEEVRMSVELVRKPVVRMTPLLSVQLLADWEEVLEFGTHF